MRGLLEVLALHPVDAQRAEEGGADRIQVVGSLDDDGYAPAPELVERMRDATTIQIRVLLRLREGFGTDGGEFTRLRGLASSYLDAGADGLVLGFLNGRGEVDTEVIGALLAEGDWPWTFDRAIDRVLDADRAWRTLHRLPRLDQVMTAGSARDLEHGLDDLIARARADADEAGLVMACGGLRTEQVPWLGRAGVRAFHVDSAVRPQESLKSYVDADLVRGWRSLIDSIVSR
ncbi:copper homeostasis protein CutC [Enemella dayhoffiae]|uniref:Copper homeostasis protein cutC homolog n=1 Tax=Enemella dayhoffiae TaxID=2016507 RepID=A0A255HA63_9ACTN|nr:copper homeostasis protein CutC [Enemella dayhoffiae]OYO24485.1 copper homeostasis protein CutC [Enemella dayhoffiae]